jgi:hypothetical protein
VQNGGEGEEKSRGKQAMTSLYLADDGQSRRRRWRLAWNSLIPMTAIYKGESEKGLPRSLALFLIKLYGARHCSLSFYSTLISLREICLLTC